MSQLPLHLRAGGVSVVLAGEEGQVPRIVHWGSDLGELDAEDLEALVVVSRAQLMPNTVDENHPVGVLAEHRTGWMGTPGLRGSRRGEAWSPAMQVSRVDVHDGEPDGPLSRRVEVDLADDVAQLSGVLELELMRSGLVRIRGTVRNHADAAYQVEGLEPGLPVPARADELLDLTGRHVRERSPQRRRMTVGSQVREGRRGRTGTDATLLMVAGEPGFGFRSGEVWGVHVAWSGNHVTRAERTPQGVTRLSGGELLLPGEVWLERGESYSSPWLYASYGVGLDQLSGRIHEYLRGRPQHPRRPRPVTLNTWEAVYFDHDLPRLRDLATLGAEVGVERFVLDDGWFHGRRDDTAGLGDWWVDSQVWPDGLHPIIDHVRGLGMEFGLWVEPEMVNPDSDLARAHPDWVLGAGGRTPVPSRFQQVVDLGHPVAWAFLLERLDALLTEYDMAYLKWDHNRDLVDAGSGPRGVPGVHRQTVALYALLDELRRRHPGVEIESCSSGGGRVDLEVLQRTERIWASDSNDPLERQSIQRWTALLVPPELTGAHIGPPRSHTTARTHDLTFRAGTALFGHLGIEWDLATATTGERDQVARWVSAHREVRHLLATGTVVRSDHPDATLWLHGVVSDDRSEAVYAAVAVAAASTAPHGQVPLPGLDPAQRYRVEPFPPGDVVTGPEYEPSAWWQDGVVLPGAALASAGVQIPAMHPEQLVLIRVAAVGH